MCEVSSDGIVNIIKIISYDIVTNCSFGKADFSFEKELNRKKLLKTRKEKLNNLFGEKVKH